ncbi:MAG: hypothetical protein FD151_1454 [bacterium]|nr:MAG: hypothetical protein FD151_1454 [bacterium]
MPAAAVIRVPQALSGIIGRKASVGGLMRSLLNPDAQHQGCRENDRTRGCERLMELREEG